MSSDSGYKEIIYKLERKNKREYLLLAAAGLIITILASISCYFFFTFLESIFHYSTGVRTVFFFIFILLAVSSAVFLVMLPLLKYFNLFRISDYYKTAREVGTYYPEVKDDLLNAMQLVSGQGTYFYSAPLIDAAFRKVYEKTSSIRFEEIVDFSRLKKLLLYSAGAAVVMVMLIILTPGLRAASNRLNNFDKEFTPPPEFILYVYPGSVELTKGDNLEIKVRVSGKAPAELYIAVKTEEQASFETEKILPDSFGVFEYTISSIRTALDYYVYAGSTRSSDYHVSITDKPLIKSFELSIRPPAYTGLPEVVQKDNGNISALPGSNVFLRLVSNKELDSAKILFADSITTVLPVQYTNAAGSFKIKGDNSYKILLTDIAGHHNDAPITYNINVENDEYPVIEMIEPKGDVNLSNDNRLNLMVKVSDDFGFSRLMLRYRLSASRFEAVQDSFSSFEIPLNKKTTSADVNYIWNLSSLSLGTDDIISYYVEIFDNDVVSGPKSARTGTYSIRIPSLDEILADADKKHNEIASDVDKTLKEAEELKNTITKNEHNLKQDKKELTWQEKEKIENALDKFQQLQDKMKESGKDLDQMQKDLQKNNLLSKETLEKYMELQKLFDELNNEEFRKAMDQMREMLQKMDRKTAQDQLENMKINEENFRKSIERTMNLLKRVKIEQKMDDLVKRSEQINKELDEMMKEQNPSDKMEKTQENMTDQLKNIENEMDKLNKDMEDMEDMPKEEMQKLSDEFDKQNNDQLSKDAQKNMQQNQMQQARQNQSQLSKNMKNFSRQMQQLQQQMMQQNQMQTFADMMKMMENIITLSKQQEELKNQNQSGYDPQANKNAEKQNNLQKNLDNLMKQMGDISQKTFAITPEMGKALGDAKREMMKSMQALQSRNGNLASLSQGNSMENLNEAASMMQNSLEAMMQGGGQGGMMSLMQQMGQMTQQQMSLNNLTQKLQQGNQGQLTPSEQGQLQRLQQQQELIKKSMEQLNREAKMSGQQKKIPANLENIVKEMEEVISDMNTQRLDDKLVQKQERILSRMLDAQRSMNERDFEKQRESNSGQDIVRESPGELDLRKNQNDKIKDELNRAVTEGYKKDYENLIRKYFEELQKEKKQ